MAAGSPPEWAGGAVSGKAFSGFEISLFKNLNAKRGGNLKNVTRPYKFIDRRAFWPAPVNLKNFQVGLEK